MSNADDRCAREGCGTLRKFHAIDFPGSHAFVEPAPQSAPSGDEATVRDDDAVDIAKRHWNAVFAAGGDQLDYATLDDACVEAYAAGKADGARAEREACEKLIRARADVAYVLTDLAAPRVRKALHDIADAIARRGSEGE